MMLNDKTINGMITDFNAGNPIFVEIMRGPRAGSIAQVVNIPAVPQREAWRIELDGKRSYVFSRLLKETNQTSQFNSSKTNKEHFDILGRSLAVGQTVAYIGPIGTFGPEICIGSVEQIDTKVMVSPKVAPTVKRPKNFRTSKSNTSILIVDNHELEPFILEKIFSND